MLPTARRFRSLLIRCGLGLTGLVSLVAAVVLISDALNATTTPRDSKSARAGSAGTEAAPTTDPDAIVPTSSSSALTQRAQAQLERLVRADEPIDGMPLLTPDRLLPIETIFAPIALVGINDLALTAAMERSAADWLPLESEITQLARANSGGFGGMAGGGFGSGGFEWQSVALLSDGALSHDASDDAFVGGSGGLRYRRRTERASRWGCRHGWREPRGRCHRLPIERIRRRRFMAARFGLATGWR